MTKSLSVERLFLYIQKISIIIKGKPMNASELPSEKEQNDLIQSVQQAEQLQQQEQQQ